MAELSKMSSHLTVSLTLRPPSYMFDHRYQSRAVYPAVEAMILMAKVASDHFPKMDITHLADVRFARFLNLPNDDRPGIDLFCELTEIAKGEIRASLTTSMKAAKSGITRKLEHARATFSENPEPPLLPPWDVISVPEGIGFFIPSKQVYSSMVPFGPTYQNLTSEVMVTPDGAIGTVQANPVATNTGHLGSPFPLDAAFHAGCAWGQRYAGFVGFPVGIQFRQVAVPTIPGEEYIYRLYPSGREKRSFTMDLYLFDQMGNLCEQVRGLEFDDMSQGSLVPPDFVYTEMTDPLATLEERCSKIAVIELKVLHPAANQAFTATERERSLTMQPRRMSGYVGGRLALKRLARVVAEPEILGPAENLETIDEDGVRPACPAPDRQHCSLSHDARFAVAVAGDLPLGVDVERLRDTMEKGGRLYLSEQERSLASSSSVEEMSALARMWTGKEAIAKAFGIDLPKTWSRVVFVEIGYHESKAKLDDVLLTVYHAFIDDHMFSLVIKQKENLG